jgi:hypothetical protein
MKLLVVKIVIYFKVKSSFILQDTAMVVSGVATASWHGVGFGSIVS